MAAIDPGVVIQSGVATTSGGGLFHVGVKRIDNGNGTYRFEYCVHNLNSHDSGGAFSVNFANGVAITNAGFHAPEWHSGSILDNNAWVVSTASNGVTFSVDQSFSQNPNSNALRWSTAFSFWFDSSDPNPLGASIDLYRVSGQVSFPAPPFPAEVWEVNSPDASLAVDGNGTNDPFVGPIQLGLASGTNHTATLGGTAGQPYQLYLQFTPAVPDYYTSADGETVNLNLGDPSFSPFFPGAPIMPAGGLNVPFNATGTFFLAGQAYCANPTNIEGFSLSAAMELDVMPLPRVVVEVVGSNSYTADTNGFWRVHHNGTTPANITDVTFDLSPIAAYFDTDQGMPSGSGSFAAGQTYEQNTDVSTGLNYAVSSPNAGSGWIGTNNISGANYNTVEFQFTGGQFNGNSFLFNADTDPGTQTAGDHAGAAITVTLSNGDVLTGTLAVDPSSSNRVFVELQ